MKIEIIVPVAGKGKRFGSKTPKQFLNLAGLPIIVHTVSNLLTSPLINGGVIVSAEEDIPDIEKILFPINGFKEKFKIISGGEKRQDSVYNGILTLAADTDIVMVHDGVRPFVTNEIIEKCVQGVIKYNSCIASIPVKDTIKQVKDGKILLTIPREELWHAQTPQAFRFDILKEAHEKAKLKNYYTTDEASLVEWAGYDVYISEGDEQNIKITTKDDLKIAENILLNSGD